MKRTSTRGFSSFVDTRGGAPARSDLAVTSLALAVSAQRLSAQHTAQSSVRRPRGDTHTPRVRDDTVEGHRGKQRGHK